MDIARLASKAYKLAGAFEADLGRRQAIRMRRVDLLEPLREQLTANSYLDLRATLAFEVAGVRGRVA